MTNPPCPPPPCPPVSPPVAPPPTAIPTQVSAAAGRTRGSLWVEGSTLRYISSTGPTFSGTGVAGATVPTAIPGSIWIEGEDVKYVDDSNILRTLQITSLGANPSLAKPGSAWIDTSGRPTGRQLEWIGETLTGFWWNGF